MANNCKTLMGKTYYRLKINNYSYSKHADINDDMNTIKLL